MKLMAKMGAAATMGAPMPATNQHEGGAAEGSVECHGGQGGGDLLGLGCLSCLNSVRAQLC